MITKRKLTNSLEPERSSAAKPKKIMLQPRRSMYVCMYVKKVEVHPNRSLVVRLDGKERKTDDFILNVRELIKF